MDLAPSFFIAAASSSGTYRLRMPRLSSAATQALIAASIFLRAAASYFLARALELVTLSLMLCMGGGSSLQEAQGIGTGASAADRTARPAVWQGSASFSGRSTACQMACRNW